MQQPVKNFWLSPQLQALNAPDAPLASARRDEYGQSAPPFAGRDTVRALEELIALHESRDSRGRPAMRAGQRSTLRQVLTLTAAAVLLLGSAAFSYLAWSATIEGSATGDAIERSGGPVLREEAGAASHRADAEAATAMRSSVLALREENGELRERLERLESALVATP